DRQGTATARSRHRRDSGSPVAAVSKEDVMTNPPMRRPLRLLCFSAFLVFLPAIVSAGEGKIRRSPNAVKDEYIVILQDSIAEDKVPDVARRVANAYGATPTRIWHSALKGFLVTMPEGRAEALSRHPDVRFVEENAEVFLSGTGTITTNVDPSTCNPWTDPNCATTVDNRI